ncbi:transporter substrate-binding domain-containing protein [Aliiglaciecola sp. 3_MG-2023]|uniref:substrate-binding periplasmic protein n=1 Tax=Aliiglaciecola sp. 3_MG-2023 TaxID=3062644 RepID=UPI0026E1371D|nr:transporter substrate-binding domain-containing protein [Aliiglaciecola sp. 3_MG-2023]MDO6695376.1 transporter substrate-binding domain-containing protein [Aliiglaciecola sp. 3_MG-2023]
MGRYIVVILITICLSAYSQYGMGQQHSSSSHLNTKVALTTGSNYYPYVDPKAMDNGWSVSIVEAVYQQMGKQIDIEILPWQRGYKWTAEGLYEGTFPYVYTEQRAKSFIYSKPINLIPVRIYTNKNKVVKSLAELHNARLCLPYGYSLSREQLELINKHQLVIQKAANAGGCLLQVAKGWSDLGFINGYLQSENNAKLFDSLSKVNILKIPVANVPLFYIVSRQLKNAQQQIDQFNQGLAQLEQSGKRREIDEKFESFLNAPESLIGLEY